MKNNRQIWPANHANILRKISASICVISGLLLVSSSSATNVRNGGLNETGYFGDTNDIQKLREAGWKCPDPADWPKWWSGYGANVIFERLPSGGKLGDAFCRISGSGGFVSGYHGLDLGNQNHILTMWAKGNGTLRAGFLAYGLKDDGKTPYGITEAAEVPGPLQVAVKSDVWVRYQHVMRKTPRLWQVHVTIAAPQGTIDFDEVDLESATPARELMVREAEKLYGAGALVENLEAIQADASFEKKREEYTAATRAFREKANGIDPALKQSVEKEIEALNPYVQGEAKKVALATSFNDMILLTRVCASLAHQPLSQTPVTVKDAAISVNDYKPGVRPPREGMVTVTDIRSDKVRYDENETAHTRATVVNQSAALHKGTLIARMHLDVEDVREIARTEFSIGAFQTKTWEFSYNVGPETYGRGIEVQFVEDSKVVDAWQEFYAVAAEWFRVQQATGNAQNKRYNLDFYTDYFNQSHEFAGEPTDFGVYYLSGVEMYRSGQVAYGMSYLARKANFEYLHKFGIKCTIYQTQAFDGQMGYEVFRRHPELALYDPNGQPAVDPVYGGLPNPMMHESPLETGPKRKVVKPYLDRQLDSSFGHIPPNLASQDAIEYEIKCILAYQKELGFDGVYVDGNWGVLVGRDYEGKPNVPSNTDKDYARIAARNHRRWSVALKKINPNFGTWYNWSKGGAAYLRTQGNKMLIGSGLPNDVSDENIRAALDWPNVMMLDEVQTTFTLKEGDLTFPAKHLQALIEERDHVVQRYGGNMVMGYVNMPLNPEEPGPSKWGWPTVNYWGAQFIATQVHFITWFVPSVRPTLQFQTRYSRLIWARDIKVVPHAEKLVKVESPEKLPWQKLVYRRDTTNGYDLLIHLVRIPPTERWDINFVDEPAPLEGVKLQIKLAKGVAEKAWALRPYYFEEPQQPVERAIVPAAKGRQVTLDVPSFRYHTMVVLHVVTTRSGASVAQH